MANGGYTKIDQKSWVPLSVLVGAIMVAASVAVYITKLEGRLKSVERAVYLGTTDRWTYTNSEDWKRGWELLNKDGGLVVPPLPKRSIQPWDYDSKDISHP